MKIADIYRIESTEAYPAMATLSEMMDKPARHAINKINWKSHPYKPSVSFSAAFTVKELILKFFVGEEYFKAEKTQHNENVYEDSCVEFFCSPVRDGIYYNFEFNAIGTCLMGSGTGRHDRKRSDPDVINKIRTYPSAGNNPIPESEGLISWTLTIAIPTEVFFLHDITGFHGKSFQVNLYKCGDKLKVPHYLSWSPVDTPKPDFHRPEYFGLFNFI